MDKRCGKCKFWKLTSTLKTPNPSGKCDYLKQPYEGYGIHSNQKACSKYTEKH